MFQIQSDLMMRDELGQPPQNALLTPGMAAAAQNAPSTARSTAAVAKSPRGEVRLSFGLFYIVLLWGKERRSSERIASDRTRYPALTSTHFPVLAAIWAAIFIAMYFVAIAGLKLLVMLCA